MKPINLLFLLLLLFFTFCQKENVSPGLNGVWVEKSLSKDTIIFDSPDFDFGENWFELRRDIKLSTGPYEYTIKEDSISIQWMLSSCYCWRSYYFKLDPGGKEFVIGKFYDSEELSSPLLRFIKTKDFN
jgi:hypothetical protein